MGGARPLQGGLQGVHRDKFTRDTLGFSALHGPRQPDQHHRQRRTTTTPTYGT